MNAWELIFQQSKVNSGEYLGDCLPAQNWDWPRGTWFQERLRHLRAGIGRYSKQSTDESLAQIQIEGGGSYENRRNRLAAILERLTQSGGEES